MEQNENRWYRGANERVITGLKVALTSSFSSDSVLKNIFVCASSEKVKVNKKLGSCQLKWVQIDPCVVDQLVVRAIVGNDGG